MLTIADLIADPEHHLFAFDGDQAVFAHMDRDAYARSIFLDGRIKPAGPRTVRAPVADLLAQAGEQATAHSAGWIFHVAHCGSTLLARALDRPGRCLSLREPLTLRQLGVERHAAAAGDWAAKLDLTRRLLARPVRAGEVAVIKANVPVNPIIPDLAARSAADPMIMLYFPLEDYLLAVLRTDNHRAWVDRVSGELQSWLAGVAPRPAGTNAERAARLWLAQISIFDAVLRDRGNARSLDADSLFAAPVEAAAAAGDLFGAPFSVGERDELTRSPLLQEYSKTPGVRFDDDARRARRDATRAARRPDLEAARAYVEAAAEDGVALPAALPRPLIGEPPALMGG